MQFRLIALSLLLLLLLTACASYGGVQDGQPIVSGYKIRGLALPWGPVYFGPEPPTPSIEAHEWCHVNHMWRNGITGLWDYTLRYGLATGALPPTSPEVLADSRKWACGEERSCGYTGLHLVCDD